MGSSSALSLLACSSVQIGCWHIPAHEGRGRGSQVGTGLGQRGTFPQQQGAASTLTWISSPGCKDTEEHLAGAVHPRYHVCPLVGPNAHRDAGVVQQALLRSPSPSPPLTTAIDRPLLLIGTDSSSGVRKQEAHFPRPRCPTRGPQAQRDPVLSARIKAWALLGAFGAAAALESGWPRQNTAGKGWRRLWGTRSCRSRTSPRCSVQHLW